MDSRAVECYTTSMDYGCGVTIFGGFELWSNVEEEQALSICKYGRGAGWAIMAFVNTPECRVAYKTACERFGVPVFQAPVRVNKNTGNQFFFAIFCTLADQKKQGYC